MSGKFKSRANCMATWAFAVGVTFALALDRLVNAEFGWAADYVAILAYSVIALAIVSQMSDEEFLQL